LRRPAGPLGTIRDPDAESFRVRAARGAGTTVSTKCDDLLRSLMDALVHAVLYAGVILLVPLSILVPLFLLEYVRGGRRAEARLSNPPRNAATGRGLSDGGAASRGAANVNDAVACRTCGAVNEGNYTFYRECADNLAGR